MARIFLVDDHRIIAETIKDFLETNGHTVVAISSSAKDALARIGEIDFDVAVIDGLKGAGASVARVASEKGKVIGFSVSDVTFGDINVNKGDEVKALLKAIARLTGVSAAETQK